MAVLGAAYAGSRHLGHDRRQRGVDDRVHGAEPDQRQGVQVPGAGLYARVWLDLRTGGCDSQRPAGDGVQRGGGAGLGGPGGRGPVGLADPVSAVAGGFQRVYGACRRGGDAGDPESDQRPGVPVRGAGAERGGAGVGSGDVYVEWGASVHVAGGGDAEGDASAAAEPEAGAVGSGQCLVCRGRAGLGGPVPGHGRGRGWADVVSGGCGCGRLRGARGHAVLPVGARLRAAERPERVGGRGRGQHLPDHDVGQRRPGLGWDGGRCGRHHDDGGRDRDQRGRAGAR